VEVVEPSSGQRRSVLLYDGIAQEEVQLIFGAAFNLTFRVVGFRDANKVYYPFSVLAMAPKAFDKVTLSLVVENAPISAPVASVSPLVPPAPAQAQEASSSEFVLTENNARKAFDILDKNGDSYLHKEEFVEVLTVAYEKFLELNTRYSFAYSCLTPEEIATATAGLFFGADEKERDFGQFCVWYVTAGSSPLCELMVLSVESLSSTLLDQYAMSPRTAKSSRNSISHLLDELYQDANVAELAANAQQHLKLSGQNLDHLLHLISESAQGQEQLGHPLYTKIFYVYLMQHSKRLTEEDTEALEVLDAIFDMLSGNQEASVDVHELAALLGVLCKGQYLKTLRAVFDMYPGANTGLVSETILTTQLTQVLRVIFYYNPSMVSVTGCYPEDLAQALSTKLFLLVEANRAQGGKLGFGEFVEAFLHGLMIALSMLRVSEGFFYDYLEQLLTYVGAPEQEDEEKDGEEEEEEEEDEEEEEEDEEEGDEEDEEQEGEDVESYEDDSQDYRIPSPQEAAAMGRGGFLEEDQVVAGAEGVDYNGGAISVHDAREVLGIDSFPCREVVQYMLQLSDDGSIERTVYRAGMTELVDHHYAASSVLRRSIMDFIVDRLFAAFDPEDSGYCSARELCCALLLFCGDDATKRAGVAWDVLNTRFDSPLRYGEIVSAVGAAIRAQLCLDPALEPFLYADAVQERAQLEVSAFFPEGQGSGSNFVELYSCILYMCESEAMDLDISLSPAKKPMRAGTPMPFQSDFNDSSDAEEDEDEEEEEEEEGEEEGGEKSPSVQTFSGDEEEEEGNVLLDDKLFPPSSVVLELRAARAVLGLEGLAADDLMESLAQHCPAGLLTAHSWRTWQAQAADVARSSGPDREAAAHLGGRIFAAFCSASSSESPMKVPTKEATVPYARIAAGLSFLCGGSPLEERLMVAHTVMDGDSDGYISPEELQATIHSTLVVLTVCSRMVADKVILLGAPLSELAGAATLEAMAALGLDMTAVYIDLQTMCEMADDFLKLAALF